ncbi:MAG: hypothetical protein EPO20_26025 [Betaproteobacteria bacterium]|nr:MAG: hypothetical protein EPO20_26025 [Betaproteobacteria bacterium]
MSIDKLTPLQRLSGALLALVWLLVVLYLVLGFALLRALAVGCLAAFLFCAVPKASVHIRLLFGAGVIAAAWSILGARDWGPVLRGLQSGIIIGAFFPTILLLRATADESRLLGATRARIDSWNETQREVWVQAASHLLGSFLMIGGYVIARSALPARLHEEQRVRLAQSAVLGLGLAACWSPFFLASAIASQLVPAVHAWQLVALGLGFAAIGWSIARLMFFRSLDVAALAAPLRGVVTFAMPSTALVALVVALSVATGLRSLEAVVLVVPPACLAYLATLGREPTLRALNRLPATLARVSDEVIVFTTAMCVGAVVAGSGAGQALSQLLAGLAGTPLLLIPAEVALIAGAGYAGLHPMISATLMLPVLAEAHRQLSSLVVAYIVVFGWVLSSLVAIWTLPVASAATNFGVPVRRLALGRNLRFVLAFGILGCMVLAALNRLMMS